MRMEATLQVRQEMQMKLAPQVIQSIEILQLPLIELQQRIDRELEENPLLEQTETEPADREDDAGLHEEPDATAEEQREADQFERLSELTEYYEKHSAGEPRTGSALSGDESEKGAKQEALENSPCPEPTLREHLLSQLAYLELDAPLRAVCEHIVANLDERGYLAYPLDDIAASVAGDAAVGSPDVRALGDEALGIVQGLEPPGVAARDLKECLLLQLDERSGDYELAATLIRGHFEDIVRNRLPKVAAATGAGLEAVKSAVETIGTLNPRPGALFTGAASAYVTPDVHITENAGRYDIMLENTWLPSLRISAYYARRLQEKDLDEKTRQYLTQKLQAAQGIISAIEQRRATLESVTGEIVRAQKEFFDRGEMYLKPLKMQDIADAVGMHVSTVSRAIAHKYAQTPQGLYSLKRFFTGGTVTSSGEVESWDVVRQKLQKIVDGEDKGNPLSDDELAEKLRGQGIDIARRTVAKYRKTLKIPSSRMRKEF